MASERVAGVYGLFCRPTQRWYIGASVDVHRRIKTHFYELKTFAPFGHKGQIGEDFLMYGATAFETIILEVVEDLNLLFERELYWANLAKAETHGYNLQAPGQNRHWSDHNG